MNLTRKQLWRLLLRNVITVQQYIQFKRHRKRMLDRSYKRKPFTLAAFTDSQCLAYFRFSKEEINHLIRCLRIPTNCSTRNNLSFTCLEGLCVVLRRLCYPNRLEELIPTFNRDGSAISRIFYWTLDFLYNEHSHLLSSFDQPYLGHGKLQEFVQACTEAGSALPNIVGFIDGTTRPICRPKRGQKLQYSGYKKIHCVKYQSIVFPNGLIGRLDGPFNGHRHDSAILHLSGLVRDLSNSFVLPDGSWLKLYGDPGYSTSKFINVGYKKYATLTPHQRNFNKIMSTLRVTVEYGFGKIIQLFAFNDFKKNNKLLLQPLKKQYIVSALLTNCHTCLRGSQVSDLFGVQPPSLLDYLQV